MTKPIIREMWGCPDEKNNNLFERECCLHFPDKIGKCKSCKGMVKYKVTIEEVKDDQA